MININNLKKKLTNFKNQKPFDYCVIDNFFDKNIARKLELEFPKYTSKDWFVYNNPLEHKKALNDWNKFPPLTYKVISYLNSVEFLSVLKKHTNLVLYSDPGLHGGGWHIHGKGGNLNPHLDYSIHPKMKLQRKLNLIIYLSKKYKSKKHFGHLGFWENDTKKNQPKNLIKEISADFNRAVIFDTSQNSWHGLSKKLKLEKGIYRKSIAVYYLTKPKTINKNMRAFYSIRSEQKKNKNLLKLIDKRKNVGSSIKTYITK